MTMRRAVLAVLAVVLVVAGCAGDDTAADGESLGVTAAPTPVTAPAIPPASPAGSGVVAIGGSTSTFSVTECRLEAAEADPSALLVLTGAGTAANGIPFQVKVQRSAANSSVASTFTDTITYTDTARILQLQRSEVAGQVSDLHDPDARSTLLRVRPDGLSATGLAGPPGTGGEFTEGIVGVALDATCPG